MELRIDLKTLRGELAFSGLVLLLFVVARFVGVAVHEIVGHGLAAALLGGSFFAVYVSPALGFAGVTLTPPSPLWADVAVLLAGIVAEVVLGLVLYRLYRRVKGFVPRLFVLLLLAVLLVHSFLYAGLGAFEATGGDTFAIAKILGAEPVLDGLRFLLPFLAMSAIAVLLISQEVVGLLKDQFPDLAGRGHRRALILFWYVPVGAGLASGALGAGLVDDPALFYLLAFSGAASALYLLGVLMTSYPWLNGNGGPAVAQVPLRKPAVTLAVVVVVWVGLFGPSPSTAHGVYLGDPPAVAERDFVEEMAINVELQVAADGNATVVMRLRGLWDPPSPLLTRTWESFETRPDWEFYEEAAKNLAKQIFNATRWEIHDARLDGTVWVDGEVLENARTFTMAPDPEKRVELYRELHNGTAIFVIDPWKYHNLPGGFIDEVVITWEEGLPDVYVLGGGIGANPSGGERELRWRSSNILQAHPFYVIQFAPT